LTRGQDQATLGASVVTLTRGALAGPDVRADLVAHYRAQIAQGSYHVAAPDLADAMLADTQTGLGTGDGG